MLPPRGPISFPPVARALAALLLAAFLLAGCGEDQPAVDGPSPETPPPAPTTTTTAVPAELASPNEAATHLYSAWEAGDRDAALAGASAEATDALFARPFGSARLTGCDAPSQVGSDCVFRVADGVLRMHVEARPGGGPFWVTRVVFAPA